MHMPLMHKHFDIVAPMTERTFTILHERMIINYSLSLLQVTTKIYVFFSNDLSNINNIVNKQRKLLVVDKTAERKVLTMSKMSQQA